jgi:hypothetical protein
MAGPEPHIVLLAPDRQERSVWVVVDPRDFVTGQRVTVPVRTQLRSVTSEPIVGASGVCCFTDLDLPAGTYTAQVRPGVAHRAHYFDGETEFALAVVPVPGQPLRRNPVAVELLPRPAYPFAGHVTLARGRLIAASNGAAIDGARITLILQGVDQGRRGRTDERGEFVVFFPRAAPEDNASAGPKDLKFRLRFEIDSKPPLLIAEKTVREGTTIPLKEIQFPGV